MELRDAKVRSSGRLGDVHKRERLPSAADSVSRRQAEAAAIRCMGAVFMSGSQAETRLKESGKYGHALPVGPRAALTGTRENTHEQTA